MNKIWLQSVKLANCQHFNNSLLLQSQRNDLVFLSLFIVPYLNSSVHKKNQSKRSNVHVNIITATATLDKHFKTELQMPPFSFHHTSHRASLSITRTPHTHTRIVLSLYPLRLSSTMFALVNRDILYYICCICLIFSCTAEEMMDRAYLPL